MKAEQKKKMIEVGNRLKNVDTLNQLQNVADDYGLGQVLYDISYRGGHLGLSGKVIAELIGADRFYLPKNYGVFVNYLGGGVRGSICDSGYNEGLSRDRKNFLDVLASACRRVYQSIESQMGLLDELDENGETNWDNLATKQARKSGIKNSY